MGANRKRPTSQIKAIAAVVKAIGLAQAALEDLERGDRVDASDSIRMAQGKLTEAAHITNKSLEATYAYARFT